MVNESMSTFPLKVTISFHEHSLGPYYVIGTVLFLSDRH